MAVWVLKFEDVDNAESDVTVFSTEADAYSQAASEIQSIIYDSWDMGDYDRAAAAKSINTYVANGEYKKAATYWNNCEFNVDSNSPYYFYVYKHDMKTPSIPRTFAPDFFSALLDEEEEEEEDDDTSLPADDLESGDGFVPSTPGATCRGTHKEWNEYASADRRDGTYLCRQCRMFRQVFGGVKKP